MTTDSLLEWYATSIVTQLSARRMLFVQMTANLEDSDGALTATLLSRLDAVTGLPVRELVAKDVDHEEEFAAPVVIVLTGLQVVADDSDAYALARMRPSLTAAVERGSLLLILSCVPRLRLTGHVGSLVSMDCAYYRFTQVREREAAEILDGIDPKEQTQIKDWSQLQPSLLRRFAAVARSDFSNRQKLAASNLALAEVYASCFEQLGPDIATWLEYWLFEYEADTADRLDVPDDILEALTSAGLARLDDAGDALVLAPGPARDAIKATLRDYLDNVVHPPPRWPELTAALFNLERMIRAAAKREYRDRHGDKWREALPEKGLAKAVGRAQAEVPAYSSVELLPNPLDWMTLSELADVVDACCQEHACLAGISGRTWTNLFMEVEPVRNRTAHMRLMRLGDLDTVRRWARQLKMRAPDYFGHDRKADAAPVDRASSS